MEGSFIGALLFGYPFVDLGILDLALLALVGFLIVWRFVPGPRPKKNVEGDSFTVGRRDRSSTELPPELRPKVPPDAARNASPPRAERGGRWPAARPDSLKNEQREGEHAVAWPEKAPTPSRSGSPDGALARKSEERPAAPRAPGASRTGEFDEEEFLEGARILYIRMQEARAERDEESLSPFMTPDMMRLLRAQAAVPRPAGMGILLLDAALAGHELQSDEERADVRFSALTQTQDDVPKEVHEIWRFARRDDAGGTWRLVGIEEHG